MFGHRTVEEAPYQVVKQDGNFELRRYAALVVAQTDAQGSYKEAGSSAFGKLFQYISGQNSRQEKVAMTAPVLSNQGSTDTGAKIDMTAPVLFQQAGNAWRFQFVLPESFTIDTAPQPINPDVTLATIPEKEMAVMRFSGRLMSANINQKADILLAWAGKQNLTATSQPQWAGFDPPWTLPMFRRNEVMVEVK